MITFPRLGTAGRLGNQLFQIAGAVSIAKSVEDRVSLPPWEYAPYFSVPKELFTNQPGRDAGEMPLYLDVRTRRFLQDISLWQGYEDIIYDMFQPSDPAGRYLEKHYPEFWAASSQGPLISLHIRRGDNASRANPDDYYPLPTMDYYRRALAMLPDNQVVVFSDEPEWCKTYLQDELDRELLVIEGSVTRPETQPGKPNPVEPMDWTDMMLMTYCEDHIIANSTYSWWGAWLSGASLICYPSVWYGSKIDYADWRLIIPNWWAEVQV